MNFCLTVLMFWTTIVQASPELDRATSLNESKMFEDASKILYQLSVNSRYRKEHGEIHYQLAKSFAGLGLKQAAIFSLIKAVNNGRRQELSKYLEVLSALSFEVGDDVGLNYALSKINLRSFPEEQKAILYFRFGQAYLKAGKFKKAGGAFAKVPNGHRLYSKARYFLGLSLSEMKRLSNSYTAFTQSVNARADEGVVDNERVAALMGRARVLYHMQRWDESLEAYRLIPRDSKYFHDMLFESSWAMLRAGKFRSALSNFQSLHSEYYDNYFYPEATLLRAIIYLYICKIDEVNKVVKVYEKTYGKVNRQLKLYLKRNKTPKNDIANYLAMRSDLKRGLATKNASNYDIPYLILRHLNRSSKVRARAGYYFNLEEETTRIENMGAWSTSTVASYAKATVQKRKQGSLIRLGRALREEMLQYRKELDGFDDQKELIKFELVSAEKEEARKKLEGRDDFDSEVNPVSSRFSFRKNGYEYWPFQGEYWLDEIGNYHYLGASRCE